MWPAGALAATWGLRAPLAAFLEKSFLGDAFATLLRAGARRDALAVLLAFAVAVPGFKGFGASPVLAFLALALCWARTAWRSSLMLV